MPDPDDDSLRRDVEKSPLMETSKSNNTTENEDNDVTSGTCRICWDSEDAAKLIRPCNCEGTSAHVHLTCIEDWLKVNPSLSPVCVICKTTYRLPAASRLSMFARKSFRLTTEAILASLALFLVLTIVARPLGFILWWLFAASNSDPFDSPMFLFMMKARETYNDIEANIDDGLDPVNPHLGDFIDRLASANQWSCESLAHRLTHLAPYGSGSEPTLASITTTSGHFLPTQEINTDENNESHFGVYRSLIGQFFNETCGVHRIFSGTPSLRFCVCSADQVYLTEVVYSRLKLAALKGGLRCPSFRKKRWFTSSFFQRDHPGENGVVSVALSTILEELFSLHGYMKGLLNVLLRIIYPKFEVALPYVKYAPTRVNWKLELKNPRFYGIPMEIGGSGGSMETPPSRRFVIKSLDCHFCITLICGMFVDLVLFLRLWYFGVNPLWDFGWQAGPQVHESGGTSSGGFKAWAKGWIASTKNVMKEQLEIVALFAVMNYEAAKEWWKDSNWISLLQELILCAIIGFLFLLLYIYIMCMVSVIVLATFDLFVLSRD